LKHKDFQKHKGDADAGENVNLRHGLSHLLLLEQNKMLKLEITLIFNCMALFY
jgi:hypothetical protein